MPRLQRDGKKKEVNTLTADISTGQLIIIICASLFVALACFGLGILVARMDPTIETPPPEGVTEAPQTTVTYAYPALGDGPVVETTPVPSAEAQPDTTAQRTPETPSPRSPFMDKTPRLTTLPPLDAQRPGQIQVAAPSRTRRPDEAAADQPDTEVSEGESGADPVNEIPQEEVPDAVPVPEPPPAESAPPTSSPPPAEPVTQPPLLTPIEPVDEPSPPPPPPPPPVEASSARGRFGIQLAALSGADRSERAEVFKRDLRSKLQVEAEIVPSGDGSLYRVLVVGFATREAANAALIELRKKPGLGEAYVREL